MSTWYQVYTYDNEGKGKTIGFKTDGIYVIDHPEWKWRMKKLSEYKQYLIQVHAQVFKICDTQH